MRDTAARPNRLAESPHRPRRQYSSSTALRVFLSSAECGGRANQGSDVSEAGRVPGITDRRAWRPTRWLLLQDEERERSEWPLGLPRLVRSGKRSERSSWRLLDHESGSAGVLAGRQESGDRQAPPRPHGQRRRRTRARAKAQLRAERQPRPERRRRGTCRVWRMGGAIRLGGKLLLPLRRGHQSNVGENARTVAVWDG